MKSIAALLVVTCSLAAQTPTIRTNAQIVIVDVTVSDNRGNPVHDLKAIDFSLTEDSKPQVVTRFEEHRAPSLNAPVALGPSLKLDPGTFTNYTPAPTDRPINVVLLDTLNTPMKDQSYVRSQLLDFVKTLQPGTSVAIFGLNSRLTLLQGFTSDPSILRAAVENKKANPRSSPLLNAPLGSTTISDQAEAMGEDVSVQQMAANIRTFEATINASADQVRSLTTLNAMNQLGRYLSAFPGRKNVIWFSGSFPINILPNADDPTTIQFTSQKEFRETTELLTRGQVAIYPVDARGLFNAPMMDASNSGARYGRNQQRFTQDMAQFSSQVAEDNTTMRQMAEATGGKAYLNTNNLRGAVENAIEAGSNFYTLSYTPTNKDWNERFRKIKVTSTRSGLQLTYRHGYYAIPSTTLHSERPAQITPSEAMRVAMMRGGPSSSEILFKTQVVPETATTEKAATNTSVASITKGPFRQYTINYAALPGDISLPTAKDGTHSIGIQFIAIAYDTEGRALTSVSNPIVTSLKAEDYAQIMQMGLKVTQTISIPVKGETFLRMGIYDLIGNKIGAVEVPVRSIPAPSHAH